MTARRWLPADYQDESIPPPRPSVDDWIVTLPGDAYALAPCNDTINPEDQWILSDGDLVKFDWTEDHGVAEFTVREDGTWELDVPAPEAPEGGYLIVAVQYDWDTMNDGLEAFAAALIEGDPTPRTVTIVFYSWSVRSVSYLFRNGKFHLVGDTIAGLRH